MQDGGGSRVGTNKPLFHQCFTQHFHNGSNLNYSHDSFQGQIQNRVYFRKGGHVWVMDKKGYILKILRQLEDEPPNQHKKKHSPKNSKRVLGTGTARNKCLK